MNPNYMQETYNLIIIGAGSGGLACANEAARRNLKVLLIEKSRVGGTCVNEGCVPKKITKNLSSLMKSLKESMNYGVSTSSSLNFKLFVKKREEFIKRLNSIYENTLKRNNVELIIGEGRITGENEVTVNGDVFKGDRILIAVGSKPKALNISGYEYLKSSDDFFKLTEVPKKAVVIGGGYIGLEIGTILKNLGSEVKFVLNRDKFLNNFDSMIQNKLMEHIEKNIFVYKNTEVLSISPNIKMNNIDSLFEKQSYFPENSLQIKLKTKTKEVIEEGVDFVLLAIGRDVSYNFLNEEFKNKLEKTKKGYLKINDKFQTSIPSIYAIGDVTGSFMLTPVAIRSGRRLAQYFKNNEVIISFKEIVKAVPSVVFSDPPCASVGLTEEECKGKEGVEIYTSKFRSLSYALYPEEEKESAECKVVVIGGRVRGIHLFGSGCEEVIQGFTLAVSLAVRIEELLEILPVHPTFSEEVVLVKK